MGTGMLAIWSDVEPAQETDYLHWLAREHTAERVGIPGFEGVRVLRAERADIRRYLILYDLATPAALTSPPYLARLNEPTPWSRRTMPHLRNFARGGGQVTHNLATGQGGHLLALRLNQSPTPTPTMLAAIAAEDRVCAIRLLSVDRAGTAIETGEKALRGGDETFPGLLLIEALDTQTLHRVLSTHRDAIAALGADTDAPTTYTTAFSLRNTEPATP